MTYDELLIYADSSGAIVREKNIPGYGGRIKGNRIAIRKNISTQAKKACILAEELGHYYTTSGDIFDQSNVMNRKQELRARMWAYDKMIGLNGIIEAYKAGCQNVAEVSEYLNVTEEFFSDAIKAYKQRYGLNAITDNYIIYFEPSLIVAEI